MEEKSMTVRDVVEQVKKELGEISVPVAQMQGIGIPIARAIEGLTVVLKAWDEAEKKDKEEENKFEITDLHVEPADDAEEQNNG